MRHVHYDVAAFERDMRANYAAQEASASNEFERLQMLGSEIKRYLDLTGAQNVIDLESRRS